MSNSIKGFKGFGKGLKCKDYQYEVGKEHVHEGGIKLCSTGFHFCEDPMDVLEYYPLVSDTGEICEFAEVEAVGQVQKEEGGNKSVTDRLKIVAKVDLPAFIKFSFGFMWERCFGDADVEKMVKETKNGLLKKNVSDKDEDKIAASGWNSQLAASGADSRLAASGADSQLAASGWNSQLAASGWNSRLAASGADSRLAASGDRSQLAASGDRSQLAASGADSRLDMTGADSIAAGVGNGSQIRGKKGCWLVLAEYNDEGKVIGVVSGQIDGKKLKEDVWYTVKKGKFVAV